MTKLLIYLLIALVLELPTSNCFDCLINNLSNYTERLKKCEVPITNIYFDVVNWTEMPAKLIQETPEVRMVDACNQSLYDISDKRFCHWKQLNFINVAQNNFSYLPSKMLFGCHTMLFLNLEMNNISLMADDAFDGLYSLRELDLSKNRIERLNGSVFHPLVELKILRLNNNRIQVIDSDHFANNQYLEALYISYNNLQTIERASFWKLKKLTMLDAAFNPDLSKIDLTRMDRLWHVEVNNCSLIYLEIPRNLVRIVADDNKITHVKIEDFGNLMQLSIGSNRFQQLCDLVDAYKLQYLDVSNNNLTTIDFECFYRMKLIQLIAIDNPIKSFNVTAMTLYMPHLRKLELSAANLDHETTTELVKETIHKNFILLDPVRQADRHKMIKMPPIFDDFKPIDKLVNSTERSNNLKMQEIKETTTAANLLDRMDRINFMVSAEKNATNQLHNQLLNQIGHLRLMLFLAIMACTIFVILQIFPCIKLRIVQFWNTVKAMRFRRPRPFNRPIRTTSIEQVVEEAL